MRQIDEITATVATFLKQNDLSEAAITCALSGGADSMTLLTTLLSLQDKFGLRISALHVNHGIRGREAERDEAFCISECLKRNVSLEVMRVDVPRLAETNHISIETAARNARYDCFRSYMELHPDTWIATAHNADDNAETLLFRIARGTALRGLGGIPPVRGRIIRPLLTLSSEQIRAHVKQQQILFVQDSTNADISYTRNYVRAEILPRLEKVHHGAVKSISCMTGLLAEDEAYLTEQARALIASVPACAQRTAIRNAPRSLARRAVRILYEEVQASPDALTDTQIEKVLEILSGARKNAVLSLPYGIEMRVEGDSLRFAPRQELPPAPGRQSVHLGVNELNDRHSCLVLSDVSITPDLYPCMNIYRILIHSVIEFDTIMDTWYIRTKEAGDAYRYGGMTHKLKKLYNDKKLTTAQRMLMPVLCDSKGILWVPGFGVRECDETHDRHKIYACYMMEASN